MAADGVALDVAECKMRSKSWWSAWPLRTGIGATGEYRERWPIWAMRPRSERRACELAGIERSSYRAHRSRPGCVRGCEVWPPSGGASGIAG